MTIRRLFAYWLDFLILAAVLIGLQFGLYTLTSGFPFESFTKGYQIELWVLSTMSFPVWLYFIFTDMKQQSIGKRWMKLKVTGRRDAAPSFGQALLRTLVKLLPWEMTHLIILMPEPWYSAEDTPANLFLIFIPNAMMLLYIALLFAGKGYKGVHDYAAGTKVLDVRI